MICKIYFPEALERSEPKHNSNDFSPRNYNYRRVLSDEDKNGREDDTDDEQLLNGVVSDSSFDEDFDFIAQQQALVDGDLAPTGSTKRLMGSKTIKEEKRNAKMSTAAGNTGGDGVALTASVMDVNSIKSAKRASSALVDKFAFEQDQTSRSVVLKRLFTCVISLNVTFIIWGVLQERMLTRRYPRFTGEFFTYSYALVFTNRFWTLIMSSILMFYFKPKRSCSTVIYEYSFPSISNMLSSWCQYESLRYVSFPAVTLFKSFKLAPVMAMGKFLGNKQCKFYFF